MTSTDIAIANGGGQLALPGLDITTTGARLVGPAADLDLDAILDTTAHLRRVDNVANWLLGDLFMAHLSKTEDPAETTATFDAQQHDDAHLSRCVALAVAVPHEVRRPGLTWSHHWEVRRLDVEDQERWLADADAQGWSVRDLRKAMAAAAAAAEPPLPGMERLPRPPERALRDAMALSRLVMWAPGEGPLSAARVLKWERHGDRLVAAVELDSSLASVLDDGDVAA